MSISWIKLPLSASINLARHPRIATKCSFDVRATEMNEKMQMIEVRFRIESFRLDCRSQPIYACNLNKFPCRAVNFRIINQFSEIFIEIEKFFLGQQQKPSWISLRNFSWLKFCFLCFDYDHDQHLGLHWRRKKCFNCSKNIFVLCWRCRQSIESNVWARNQTFDELGNKCGWFKLSEVSFRNFRSWSFLKQTEIELRHSTWTKT